VGVLLTPLNLRSCNFIVYSIVVENGEDSEVTLVQNAVQVACRSDLYLVVASAGKSSELLTVTELRRLSETGGHKVVN
jgi:hypothetical protein